MLRLTVKNMRLGAYLAPLSGMRYALGGFACALSVKRRRVTRRVFCPA